MGGEGGGKARVHPLHHTRIGTEVAQQAQGLQPHAVEALQPRLQEQPHVGAAEAVDGLHAVPYHHDGARGARVALVVDAPAAGEQPQQLVLVDRRILELVHQDVLNAVIQAQRQLRGRIVLTQGLQRRQRYLAVIHGATTLEYQQQLRRQHRQYPGQVYQQLPAIAAGRHLRQEGDIRQQLVETIELRQLLQQRLELVLARLGLALAGGKSNGGRDALAPAAVLGQQQLPQGAPGGDIPGAGTGKVRGHRGTRVVRRVPPQVQQLTLVGPQALAQGGEFRCDQCRHRRHQVGLGLIRRVVQTHVGAPLLAPCQHLHQQVLQALPVIVEVQHQGGHIGGGRVPLIHLPEQVRHRLGIQLVGIVQQRRLATEFAEHRHLPGQGTAEAVYRLDVEAGDIPFQLPVVALIGRQRRPGEFPGNLLVRVLAGRVAARSLQGLDHPAAHFRGGLAGKGNRQHLLGSLDPRQQPEIALDQQFGLAGARRGADTKAAARVDGEGTLGGVDNAHSASSSATALPIRHSGCRPHQVQLDGPSGSTAASPATNACARASRFSRQRSLSASQSPASMRPLTALSISVCMPGAAATLPRPTKRHSRGRTWAKASAPAAPGAAIP